MSSPILKTFAAFCEESSFRFQPLDGDAFIGHIAGRHGRWNVFVRVRETLFTATSVCPLTVPPSRQATVLDYINRANWQLAVGNLEMDPDDGEVSLRTSLNSLGDPLTTKAIGALLLGNVYAFDHYLPGLLAVTLGHTPPAEAMQALAASEQESDSNEDDLAALLRDLDLDQRPGPEGDN